MNFLPLKRAGGSTFNGRAEPPSPNAKRRLTRPVILGELWKNAPNVTAIVGHQTMAQSRVIPFAAIKNGMRNRSCHYACTFERISPRNHSCIGSTDFFG